jgi:protein arginine kinase activator
MPKKEKHEDSESNEQEPALPDRPIECTECKRPIAVYYTEIVDDNITHTCMCSECPVLRRRLHGTPHTDHTFSLGEAGTGLVCGNCGTTLDAIKLGALLGCDVCYDVFNDILIAEMVAAGKLPARAASAKKNIPVHIGRSRGEMQEMSAAARLLALHEALNEMLKSEDYEQAAFLRDQIKALTEKTGTTEKKPDEKQ